MGADLSLATCHREINLQRLSKRQFPIWALCNSTVLYQIGKSVTNSAPVRMGRCFEASAQNPYGPLQGVPGFLKFLRAEIIE